MEFQLSYFKSLEMMLWKCCTQYASKSEKLSSGHRTEKGQLSFQSQRKTMPKNVQTTAQLLAKSRTRLSDFTFTFHFSLFMHWRRKWQPTPVFLPGESQGWGRLVGCRLHRDSHDCSDLAAAWAFFGIVFLWDWNENWPFPVLWLLLSFPNLLAYWVQHFHSIIFQDLK